MLAETVEIVLPSWCFWIALAWVAKALLAAFVAGVLAAVRAASPLK